MTEELYGHRLYSGSDFGFWSCSWCGASGSDHPDDPEPQNVPCEGGGLAASWPAEAVRAAAVEDRTR